MNFMFHNISGNVIIPIDERIFFKMVTATNQMICGMQFRATGDGLTESNDYQ